MSDEGGRPSSYTREIADEVLERMAMGEPLRQICRDEHMPTRQTVRNWAYDDRDGFFARYTRARELQADEWAEECLDIADDNANDLKTITRSNGQEVEVVDHDVIQRAKLKVDTRKWLASVLKPEYNPTHKHEHTGKGGSPIQIVYE